METPRTAVETTGTLQGHQRLKLDEALPIPGSTRVKVIVLYPLQDQENEGEWLRAAAQNPAFRDLDAPEEDIYSLNDGEPFRDPV